MRYMTEFVYAVISDVHLGHRKNTTAEIIKNLEAYVSKLPDDIQALFIAGDLYDRLLDNSMPDNIEIKMWMYRLLTWCDKRDVMLRILEGTPSHDWKQSSVVEAIAKIARVGVDVRHVVALSIEVLSNGISVLYVPDEWDVDPENTFSQVKDLMLEKGLSKVDIAVMHGQFTYQVPNAPATVPKHSEESYLDIVKHYVHIGHVHTHSYFDRIVAQGSFDRLAHGEEEPKGGVIARVYGDKHSYEFVENKGAMIFKTIQVRGSNLEEVIAYLDKQILKHKEGSHIRLKGSTDHTAFKYYDELKKRYALYNLLKKGDIEDEAVPIFVLEDEHHHFSITEENVEKLLRDCIVGKYTFSDKHWGRFEEYVDRYGRDQ